MSLAVFDHIEKLKHVAQNVNGDTTRVILLNLINSIENHIVDDTDYTELPLEMQRAQQLSYIDNEAMCAGCSDEGEILGDIHETLKNAYK